MAALTATGWTISITDENIQSGERRVHASLTLPTAGEYPSNGIPLPTGSLGMHRNLAFVSVMGADVGNSTIVKFDEANKTLRAFVASTGAEVATTATVGAGGTWVAYVEAVGW